MPFNLNDLTTNFGSQAQINTNSQTIEDEVNNNLLKRNNPRGDANQMEIDLDMNSNNITNAASVATASLTLGGEAPVTSLADLKGDKGDTGDTGPQGIQGIQGLQGIQGPQGDTGTSYTVSEIITMNDLPNVTTSVADAYSYLITDYSTPDVASQALDTLTVRVADHTPPVGYTMRAVVVSSVTTGGLGYLTMTSSGAGHIDSDAVGAVNGGYRDFTLDLSGAGASVNPTNTYIIIDYTGVDNYYADNVGSALYILKVSDYLSDWDGNGTIATNDIASYLAIKDGAGRPLPTLGGLTPVTEPAPFTTSFYTPFIFGTGPTGPQGVQGVQGIQGVQGPQGIQGPQGADGGLRIRYSTPTNNAGEGGAIEFNIANANASFSGGPVEHDIAIQKTSFVGKDYVFEYVYNGSSWDEQSNITAGELQKYNKGLIDTDADAKVPIVANSVSVWTGSTYSLTGASLTGGVTAGTYIFKLTWIAAQRYVVFHIVEPSFLCEQFIGATGTGNQVIDLINWDNTTFTTRSISQNSSGTVSVDSNKWAFAQVWRVN